MGRYGVIRQDTCTNVLPINMRAVAYNKEKRIAHSQSKIIAFLACSFNNPLLARVNGSKCSDEGNRGGKYELVRDG